MPLRKLILYALSLAVIVFLGDLLVKKLNQPSYDLDQLTLNFKSSDYDKLDEKVQAAHDRGYYLKGENEYVEAKIEYLNYNGAAKTRLKGDWLDHFGEKKWSFRIKLDDPLEDGLKTFSIQNPNNRGLIKGFQYVWMMQQEGIIANEYRLIELVLNDESWGTYLLEEHLTQRLIDQHGQRKGIILKFKDDAFFEADIKKENTVGLIKNAEIKMYGDLKDDPQYAAKIKKAKKLMRAYQAQTDSVYNYFDPQKMGAYYAVCDVTRGYHSMGWINVRFFFDFETELLEPIAYDPYPQLDWGKPFLGANYDKVNLNPLDPKMVVYNALNNEAIKKAYDEALNRMITPSYVQDFNRTHQNEIKKLERELQKEFSDFSYDSTFLTTNVAEISQARN